MSDETEKARGVVDPENFVLENRGRVKKANSLVMHRASGALEVEDHKLFNYLLNRAWPYLPEGRKLHRIPVRDAIEFLGGAADVDTVHESLRRLGRISIEIEYEEVTGEKRVAGMHFLSFDASRADSGILYFVFDEMLLPMLMEPKIFALLSLKDVRHFKTLAGERLYETMMLHKNNTFNHVWRIPIQELQDYFGVPEGTRFDNFRRRIIEPAVDEVNRHAPFNVRVDYIRGGEKKRGGRRVHWVEFTVHPKTHQDMMAPLKGRGSARKGRDANSIDLFDRKTDSERGSDLVLSETAVTDAAAMVEGKGQDLDKLEASWRAAMNGRVVNNPDQQFLNWVAMQIEKSEDPRLKSVSDDILGEFLENGE